ncbi:hypothetical protein JCM8547_006445 [Rhodosporidiobolus lusitaniae]
MARTKQKAHHLSASAIYGAKRAAKKTVASGTGGVKKPHRFRPGTVALREGCLYQKQTGILIRKLPFQRLVREICNDHREFRWQTSASPPLSVYSPQGAALEALQEAAEMFLIDLFSDRTLCAIHAKRVTMINRPSASPETRILGDTLNITLLLVKHWQDLVQAGPRPPPERAPEVPIFFGAAALVARLEEDRQSRRINTSSYKLAWSVLFPTRDIPVEVYFPESLRSISPAGTAVFNLIKALHNGKSRIPFAPVMRGIPMLSEEYRRIVLQQGMLRHPQTGDPLPLEFRIPEPHLLLFQTLNWVAHSITNAERWVAFFRLLILVELDSIYTSDFQQKFVNLYETGTMYEKSSIDSTRRKLREMGEEEVRAQVEWHMRNKVTEEGRMLHWDARDLERRYLRALQLGKRLLQACSDKKLPQTKYLMICRRLLAPSTPALYDRVTCASASGLAQLAARLLAHPALPQYVKGLFLVEFDSGLGRKWASDLSDGATGLCFSSSQPARNYDPNRIRVGLGTLKDLLRGLPNLRTIGIHGAEIATRLFSSPFLTKHPLLRVDAVTLQLFEANDLHLLRHLSLFPALKHVDLVLPPKAGLALPLLNCGISSHLTARSWNLTSFAIYGTKWVGPELRHLATSLTMSLTSLVLENETVPDTFPQEFSCFPPSLVELALDIGPPCSAKGGEDPRVKDLSKLFITLSPFPLLKRLGLRHEIVDLGTLSSISSLKHLEYLHLGQYTLLSPIISSWIGSSTSEPLLPNLKELIVDPCRCPLSAGKLKHLNHHERWATCFAQRDGEEVLRRCAERGVELDGTLRCA